MDIQQYVEEMENFQEKMLQYLDKKDNYIDNFNMIMSFLKNIFNGGDYQQIKEILKIINKISNHYHRVPDFFAKFFKILNEFNEKIKQTFSNLDIFKIFRHNKRILLFLIENTILEIDQSVINFMKNPKNWQFNFIEYFYREAKPFLSKSDIGQFTNSIEMIESDEFIELRRKGENDSFICELIRNDSIIEFITYINQTNYSIQNKIKKSIFETNPFLIKNKNPSLIEYSAFFGSIQIFKYLTMNEAVLTPSLWLYAIHGSNPEIIHFLEENHIDPDDITFNECLKESIKCFHNDIAFYIQDNLIENQSFNYEFGIKYHNYFFFYDDFQNRSDAFYYLCKYNYIFLVDKILELNKVNIFEETIQTNTFKYDFFYLFFNDNVFNMIFHLYHFKTIF